MALCHICVCEVESVDAGFGCSGCRKAWAGRLERWEMTPPTYGREWHDLSASWAELGVAAAARDDQKTRYASTRLWAEESTHMLGLCGEKVLECVTGIPVDLTLRRRGDRGRDGTVGGMPYDVKASTYWWEPHLRETPSKCGRAALYVLTAVDFYYKRGFLVGWATREQVMAAPQRDYGKGKRYFLTEQDLVGLGQAALPGVFFEGRDA